MPLDPEELITDWERRVGQQTALTTELSRRMQETTATAESPGGEAAVTVDHSGGLSGLRLGERAMRLPPGELAEIIVATSRRAQAVMAQRMAELVGGLYGADSDTAVFIAGAYAEQFPEPPDDERSPR
ncbi:YbaB/EbfC family nucleoid-associated protein [Jidongwangia harbinensis]|uniref:YbaB/EbfC family nucleoid-associated protein n=1 Tax=Jidongwangia harbinensis TaxID=2878561 RepID=UPI001CD9C37D|nr:YbaB/EbfC family nucleoid-associated protein [Jidongwangia harbinensis]MCA2211827.1 YbaB/EbfC family nucleoid-associated protein [Jidongwangia harbinensis]